MPYHKAKVELAKHGLMKTLEEIACCNENTDGDNLAKTVSVIVRKIQWIWTVNLSCWKYTRLFLNHNYVTKLFWEYFLTRKTADCLPTPGQYWEYDVWCILLTWDWAVEQGCCHWCRTWQIPVWWACHHCLYPSSWRYHQLSSQECQTCHTKM